MLDCIIILISLVGSSFKRSLQQAYLDLTSVGYGDQRRDQLSIVGHSPRFFVIKDADRQLYVSFPAVDVSKKLLRFILKFFES